jgi:hypothetical protein
MASKPDKNLMAIAGCLGLIGFAAVILIVVGIAIFVLKGALCA